MLDIKKDFPVLNREFGGMPLHYLDSAATTQKPLAVIEAMDTFYRESYGTVRRGVYRLSEKATAAYEGTRKKVAALINAASEREIIYTSGTTQSINLVAYSYGRGFLKAGDEIILSQIEHHANIVPWQIIAGITGAVIKTIPVDDTGTLILEEYKKLLGEKTRIVAVNHISNALGTVNPVKEIIRLAHLAGPGGPGKRRRGPGRRRPIDFPHAPWTCAIWMRTSTPSPAIRCSAPRASASCTASTPCSNPCPPTRAAGT